MPRLTTQVAARSTYRANAANAALCLANTLHGCENAYPTVKNSSAFNDLHDFGA